MSLTVKARSKESLVVNLEKKVRFDVVEKQDVQETKQEKIQRIKNEKLYHKVVSLDNADVVRFVKVDDELQMQYVQAGEAKNITKLPLVKQEVIRVSSISGSDDVFLALWSDNYIYQKNKQSLHKLPYSIDIRYIKSALNRWNYLVVTNNGTFLYDSIAETSEFQYLFHDFVYSWEYIIGIILESEEQKKKNFSLTKPGNLIIRYSQSDKTREVLYSTKQSLDKITWQGDKIIFGSQGTDYELVNFK